MKGGEGSSCARQSTAWAVLYPSGRLVCDVGKLQGLLSIDTAKTCSVPDGATERQQLYYDFDHVYPSKVKNSSLCLRPFLLGLLEWVASKGRNVGFV